MTTSTVLGDMLAVASDRLAGYGYLLTGSAHAGEELAQAAIVKVFVRRRRLNDVRAAEAYVKAADAGHAHVGLMRYEAAVMRSLAGDQDAGAVDARLQRPEGAPHQRHGDERAEGRQPDPRPGRGEAEELVELLRRREAVDRDLAKDVGVHGIDVWNREG